MATEPITVYKLFLVKNKNVSSPYFFSPYRDYIFGSLKEGKTLKPDVDSIEAPEAGLNGFYKIGGGYLHSWSRVEQCVEAVRGIYTCSRKYAFPKPKGQFQIGECVIPVGAKYYFEEDPLRVKGKSYASDSLIFKGIVVSNNFTKDDL